MGGSETIREIDGEACRARIEALSSLLVDAVDSGASIGFLPPMEEATARAFWHGVANTLVPTERRLLIAEEDSTILGSVQLGLATQPNAAHRAEVMKLFVRKSARGRGIGARLMTALENLARSLGRELLVLDTRQGDDAERLYRRLGYLEAGAIPRYAESADGTRDATVIMYKELGAASG